MAVWSVVKASDLAPDLRLDAEYYRPDLLDLDRQLAGMNARPWGQLAGKFIVGPFGSDFNVEHCVESSPYRYIRGKDVKPFLAGYAFMPEQYFRLKSSSWPLETCLYRLWTLGNARL
jgi:hypothetical protein